MPGDSHRINECEEAFFAALTVIVKTAVEAGIDCGILADRLQTAADGARADSRITKAATLELVATMANSNRYSAPRPIFHVIRGGRDDTSN